MGGEHKANGGRERGRREENREGYQKSGIKVNENKN